MHQAHDFDDIIVAPITGGVRAPVAVIRVSGKGCWRIAYSVFKVRSRKGGGRLKPRHIYIGTITANFQPLDEGILVLLPGGRSYTGEESFELSCHGSPQIVRRLVEEIVRLGARPARPGEFTERAFLNGRIDLTQAEAVRETVEAATDAQLRRAALLREGRLAQQAGRIEERIGQVLAMAEASVDFSEEVGELDREAAVTEIGAVCEEIRGMLAGFGAARLLREGLRVAIVGRPNVGKSSLLNALLGAERAIVTEVPGTTRDTIEETVSVGGYPVVLTDTAGIREAEDVVEKLGVERSRRAVETADQIWLVFEAHRGWAQEDEELARSLYRRADVLIGNKADLGVTCDSDVGGAVYVSALTGAGMESLCQLAVSAFDTGSMEIPLINERHKEDLEETLSYLEHAAGTLCSDLPTDLACVDLYGALQSVGRITGRTASAEVIERVFKDFCIGK